MEHYVIVLNINTFWKKKQKEYEWSSLNNVKKVKQVDHIFNSNPLIGSQKSSSLTNYCELNTNSKLLNSRSPCLCDRLS